MNKTQVTNICGGGLNQVDRILREECIAILCSSISSIQLSNMLEIEVTFTREDEYTTGTDNSSRPGEERPKEWASRDHFPVEGGFNCIQLRTKNFDLSGSLCRPLGVDNWNVEGLETERHFVL